MRWFWDMCMRAAEARQPQPSDPEPEVEPAPRADEAPPTTGRSRLGPNFTVAELTRSRTARAKGIDNTPTPEHINNLRLLVSNVLQPARNALGAITVNSGYRSPELNRAIGGARRSDHMRGCAADIVATGDTTLEELGKWIQDNCQFRQLIYEFGEWIHVAYDPQDQRQQVLEAYHVVKRNKKGEEVKDSKGRPVYTTRYRTYRFE